MGENIGMKVDEQLRDGEGLVEFSFQNDPRLTVTVFVYGGFGQPVTAQVNWSAVGSVRPAVAFRYGRLIEAAARWAASYNDEHAFV